MVSYSTLFKSLIWEYLKQWIISANL
jgi:hypothetical protein